MSKKRSVNRREFLKLAGLAAIGGTVVASTSCSGSQSEGMPAGGEIKFSKETDALIIGAGGAGLWAAYELVEAGFKPLIVEKAASWGGDTILACGVLPIHGTIVQKQQGIQDMSPEEAWEKAKDFFKDKRVPELARIVYINAARAIDILTEKFGVKWMPMDPNSYTKFFHIPEPGMQNDHKLLEPLYKYSVEKGAEYLFETKAISFIVNQRNEPVGVRVQDQVSGKFMDIRAKKILLATGDFISNQEMVAKYLPQWAGVPVSTYGSMGEGILMAMAIGASTTDMESTVASNLMSHFAPTVVWGYYNSIIHVSASGKRMCNENQIFKAPDICLELGDTFWWTIFDESLVNGYHKTSYQTREKQGGVVVANTIEELAEKTLLPYENLKATIEKYNSDAEKGEDTEFGKKVCFYPLKPPYYAVKNKLVRYKATGGLSINERAQVIDRAGNPIPNLFAAGSCQGETTPNVADAFAVGMLAGQIMAQELKSS
ncbi:MAG: FAD-dependent oxidoreductase [Candidatus Methanomethylicaceae archaeon]